MSQKEEKIDIYVTSVSKIELLGPKLDVRLIKYATVLKWMVVYKIVQYS